MGISIGNNIRKLRKQKGFTQKELAEKCNLSRSYLADLERGRYNPSLESLKLIANSLNVNISLLLEENGEEEVKIPKEYTEQYKVTLRDKEQYLEHMKKVNETFFMNDNFDEEDKKEILDTMSELFWKAKMMNKRKPKK